MMNKLLYLRFLPAFLLLFLPGALKNAGAQGIDINAKSKKGIHMGFNISPVKTSVVNKGTGSLTKAESSPATSISALLEIGYSLSPNLDFSSGAGFIIYNSSINLGAYTTSYDTTDSENEAYKRHIDGNGISETQKITFLTIPVMMNISIPVTEKFGFYIRPGIKMLLHLNSAYDNSGTFNYSGYYPKYNVTISDVPFEGFETAANNIGSGELLINPLNFELYTSAGAEFSLQRKLKLTFGVEYRKVLSSISDYEVPASFKLTTKPGQMNSIMAGCEDISAKAFGISVGLRYYLK